MAIPKSTDETDYLVTATYAQAGKPDTDSEIASTNFDGPPKGIELRAAQNRMRMEARAKSARMDYGY